MNGVPDYSAATNARRLGELKRLQDRLQAIDTTGWSIPERVDHHVVRAEMNGMEYHLRVLQPFARDPAYYASIISAESDTPSKEGPVIHGAIKLYDYPDLAAHPARQRGTALGGAGRRSVVEASHHSGAAAGSAASTCRQPTRRDLWVGGVRAFEEQVETLAQLASRVGGSHAGLSEAIATARSATEAVRVVAESRGAEEDRPLGDRQGPVHLVPAQRAARAALVGGRSHDHATRAGEGARVAASRGEPQPPAAAARRG